MHTGERRGRGLAGLPPAAGRCTRHNPDTLAAQCGLGIPDVEASLARLERSCLVERTGSSVRLLSFGEALIHNQCKI